MTRNQLTLISIREPLSRKLSLEAAFIKFRSFGWLPLNCSQAGFNCRISIGFMLVSPRCLIFSCDMLLSYVPAHAPVL